MLDGKGLVYQKRAGTGSAVYTGPAAQIGANPLDALANQIRVEGKYKAAAAAKQKAEEAKTLNVDLTGWDYDNKRFFSDLENKLKQEGMALKMAGKSLDNYADKEVLDWHKKVDEGQKAALASVHQGDMYKAFVDMVNKDPDKYDKEQSMTKIGTYMQMTPVERLSVDPQSLAVFRYDPYGPVEKLDIDRFGSKDEWKGLTSEGFKETLQTKKLRSEINSLVENPENLKFYEYNKDKYGWENLNDYKEFLYKYKKNQFVADSKYGLIKPTNTYGWGFQDYYNNVANSDGLNINVATAQPSGKSSPTLTQNILLDKAQGVAGVNLVIPGGEANILKKNELGVGAAKRQGNYTIQNANLGIALVQTMDGKLLPSNPNGMPTGEYYDIKDAKGVTKKMTTAEAFKQGLVRYTPIIQGTGKFLNALGMPLFDPIAAQADKFITPDMAQKSAAENDAYQKLLALNQVSDEYNQRMLQQANAAIEKKPAATEIKANTGTMLYWPEYKAANPKATNADYIAYKKTFK
jgi:hypothetical protein